MLVGRRRRSARCCSPARTRSARSTGCARAAGRSPSTRRPASPARCSSSAPALGAGRLVLASSAGSACSAAGARAGRRWCSPSSGCRGAPVAAAPARVQAGVETVRPGHPARRQRRVVRPARRVRAHPRGARLDRLDGHDRRCGARAAPAMVGGGACVFVVGNALAFGLEALVAAHPGAAPRVLRAVLPGLPAGGPPVPAVARPDGRRRITSTRRHHVGLAHRRPRPRWRRRHADRAAPRGASRGRSRWLR